MSFADQSERFSHRLLRYYLQLLLNAVVSVVGAQEIVSAERVVLAVLLLVFPSLRVV